MPQGTQKITGNTFGFETITVSTAVGFTAAKYSQKTAQNSQSGGVIPRNATVAMVTVDGTAGTNDIRWTTDGTAPVGGSTGHIYQAKSAEPLVILGYSNIANFRMIKDGATNAVVQVTYQE